MMFADGLPTILRHPIAPIDNRICRTLSKAVSILKCVILFLICRDMMYM